GQPRSTRVPSTTLFRSIGDARQVVVHAHRVRRVLATHIHPDRLVADGILHFIIPVHAPVGQYRISSDAPFVSSDLSAERIGRGEDRKSTRLNSSHVKIS